MKFSTVFTLSALSVVTASNLDGALSTALARLSTLDSMVAAYNSGQGLMGALAIQSSYNPMSSAIVTLSSSVAAASVNDITVANTNGLANTLSSLLNHLADKSGDFKAVGAQGIVKDDINGLLDPAKGIESNIISKASACSLHSSVSSLVGRINPAFTRAGNSYSLDVGAFPQTSAAC